MQFRHTIVRQLRKLFFLKLCFKYRQFSMAPWRYFWRNMIIVDQYRHVQGCVIEAGVWRGGMSAGMAEVLGKQRSYFLFDSFEGLPPATELDGEEAKAYQRDTESPTYFDNCSAEMAYAETAMQRSGATNVKLVKGWFQDTMPDFVPPEPIAVLRLDGDWYDSTMVILNTMTQYLAPDALIIIDDYYAWQGCRAAVHDYLSQNKLNATIHQEYGICVLHIHGSL